MDYAVEKSNGKKIVTNQHIHLMLDGNLKDFHFNGISNSSITEVRESIRFWTTVLICPGRGGELQEPHG